MKTIKLIKSNETTTTIESGNYAIHDNSLSSRIIEIVENNEQNEHEITITKRYDDDSDENEIESGNVIIEFNIDNKYKFYSLSSNLSSYDYETIFNDVIDNETYEILTNMFADEYTTFEQINDVNVTMNVKSDSNISIIKTTDVDDEFEPETFSELIEFDNNVVTIND